MQFFINFRITIDFGRDFFNYSTDGCTIVRISSLYFKISRLLIWCWTVIYIFKSLSEEIHGIKFDINAMLFGMYHVKPIWSSINN